MYQLCGFASKRHLLFSRMVTSFCWGGVCTAGSLSSVSASSCGSERNKKHRAYKPAEYGPFLHYVCCQTFWTINKRSNCKLIKAHLVAHQVCYLCSLSNRSLPRDRSLLQPGYSKQQLRQHSLSVL